MGPVGFAHSVRFGHSVRFVHRERCEECEHRSKVEQFGRSKSLQNARNTAEST